MPRYPWKCHRWGTFCKLDQINPSLHFPRKAPPKHHSEPLPANLYEGMSVGFGLPTKSPQRCMRLHINCIEFDWPWASLAFMLNISGKYEMEITFSILAFPSLIWRLLKSLTSFINSLPDTNMSCQVIPESI